MSVAMDDDGDFVVLYHMSQTKGSAYHFQRYNALAQAQGKPVKVLEQSMVTSAAVAMDADGDFAVAMPVSGISVEQFLAPIQRHFDRLTIPSRGITVEKSQFLDCLSDMFHRDQADEGILFEKARSE